MNFFYDAFSKILDLATTLLGISLLSYGIATILYIVIIVFKLKKPGIVATLFTLLGFLIQTAWIIIRWQASYAQGSGHAPMTNMFESVVFFAWSIVLMYLIMEWKFKTRVIGAFAVPFAFLAMLYASEGGLRQEIPLLVPALQSNWLVTHVTTCFIGYAAFAVAAGLGFMYMIKNMSETRNISNDQSIVGGLPPLKTIDDITHKTMVFGFLWLSLGIISGAIWANSAWGTYWSWDPKETWSLITWFIYAITLHARYTQGWGGMRIAILALLGFVAVLFTYYGVNFWLSGLHSYGSPG